MSWQYVQYSNENSHYMITGSFTYFTSPLKMNHLAPLKTTSTENPLSNKTCCGQEYSIMNTTLSLKKTDLFSLLLPPTCTIIFSPAATICKQHTERVEPSYHGQGLAEGSDGHLLGRMQSADCRRLEGLQSKIILSVFLLLSRGKQCLISIGGHSG